MEDNVTSTKNDIRQLLTTLKDKTQQPFLLVGGSSLILHGSHRVTNDIDLLVPRDAVNEFSAAKEAVLNETEHKHVEKIDLLNAIADRFDFESIKFYTSDIGGFRVPDLDVMLGSKVLSHYLRADGEEGDAKRSSDLDDINWISKELQKRGLKVKKDVSDKLVCGPYNMLLVVADLHMTFGDEGLKAFESVGGREFECDWGTEEFREQVELYEIEVEESEYAKILESHRRSS
ncbi:hypothetical protein APHAL10511_007490 [Amanita phalloides]|nr:hypothetical protein APHAL10511_007490 [Amanita phalloides]